jgi:hypothetical protein
LSLSNCGRISNAVCDELIAMHSLRALEVRLVRLTSDSMNRLAEMKSLGFLSGRIVKHE